MYYLFPITLFERTAKYTRPQLEERLAKYSLVIWKLRGSEVITKFYMSSFDADIYIKVNSVCIARQLILET